MHMLRSLSIQGFRAFDRLRLDGLGRVNLVVGTNNCGKTSVLEAVSLVAGAPSLRPLLEAQAARGELLEEPSLQVDVAQLIHGRTLRVGAGFQIDARTHDGKTVAFDASVVARTAGPDDEVASAEDLHLVEAGGAAQPLALHVLWHRRGPGGTYALSPQGGLRSADAATAPVLPPDPTDRVVAFLPASGLDRERVVAAFEQIVLKPEEAIVLEALREIEPRLERLATVGRSTRRAPASLRGGLVALIAGQRVPIGSLGDGIWRMLGVALALSRAQGGTLLIDEIDTGLHYSVMQKMWEIVRKVARLIDVQVFATTHSRDCYEALAAIAEPGRAEISLQRIERGRPEAIAFSEAEIRQAAERGLEVR